jgi:hypothetical protein
MKLYKEYPATHSMSTAWYVADEEGNVAIIDIEDNGPVPVGEYKETCVNDIFWQDFSSEGVDTIRNISLLPEQILPMLEPNDEMGIWEIDKHGWHNYEWSDSLFRIDMTKYDVFKKALSLKDHNYSYRPVCLSKEMGLFFADFFDNKLGVDLLVKNKVVLKKYHMPYYETPDEYIEYWEGEIDEEYKSLRKNNQKFPVFIFWQGYSPSFRPAVRITAPKRPLTVSQLPTDLQSRIKRLPVKFEDLEFLQMAEYVPVSDIGAIEYVYDGKIWYELAKNDHEKIYYHVGSRTIMDEKAMHDLIEKGLSEEYDYQKHHEMKFK